MLWKIRDLLSSAPTGDININSYWITRLKKPTNDIFITIDLVFPNGKRLRLATIQCKRAA